VSTEIPAAGGSKLLGRHIVVDPAICHGQPTFRGTRILVADVMDQVGRGLAWEAIIEEWDGRLPRAAIAEAVQLATQAFLSHTDEFVIELSPT
jgi:uncharacterized protein (DUF433 family)